MQFLQGPKRQTYPVTMIRPWFQNMAGEGVAPGHRRQGLRLGPFRGHLSPLREFRALLRHLLERTYGHNRPGQLHLFLTYGHNRPGQIRLFRTYGHNRPVNMVLY